MRFSVHTIVPHDVLILSYRANPAGWNFLESQVPLAGWKRSINQDILKS